MRSRNISRQEIEFKLPVYFFPLFVSTDFILFQSQVFQIGREGGIVYGITPRCGYLAISMNIYSDKIITQTSAL
jgi:hypothetical protein